MEYNKKNVGEIFKKIDDQKKNQIIRVQNSSSNKLIYCRVAAPGLVEVIL